MSKLCLGFEVHQPYRLDPAFNPQNGKARDLESLYFSPQNKEILERVADKCYIPATQIVLESLDKGFKCAFSLSGTVVEQLEKWRPDALELFRQVARHRNAELLSQTYYHSVASLFSDLEEFELQVRLHKRAMKSIFGVTPKVMENTEFIFNNAIAKSASQMGFTAVYTEGVERVLGWRSPNYVYSCSGVKLLMRNYRLSDDVAFRFNNRDWDQYPLTADKFASWVASSPGDYVNVFVDYETFGEHHWADTGIMDFLKWLPVECENRGVEFLMPSEAAEIEPKEELSIEETISWADVEKDASAWLGNTIQYTALKAIQRAKAYAYNKKIWRYLQTSDHFYYMASKFGACAEVHSYFSPGACQPYDSFATYMKILAHYERTYASRTRRKAAAMELRALEPAEAFHFFTPTAYTGFTAYGLDDLSDLLNYVPKDSVEHHMARGDFSRWIEDVLGDKELAEAVAACKTRLEVVEVIEKKREELWKSLK
ncbi:Alpha-amylase/alpha-mannosidase [Methanocella conradii HZ254]|uniref:Alpha-amylase/alpha-mannosidase n=1 Tax=Methanocella conradii (strain DSM 24694 / JCM 17849 / CGMCC 1.5162 / HZ254) TaxID=1041930 RepID=H8I833_METCZ|nr:glycoside hydrolase family 57 protein [Methanocella conradii]AFD00851.1 Alpha-amylase/alpha-mannosidase [Methanocella conradii HZ254]MDI6897532.1 glycoside hydrolase family 57 protein [Methanocella conradii]